MNRNPYTEELVGTLPEGDMGWRGVNMRLAPAQLSAGWASKAVNMRFTDGRPQTRGGKCPVVWLNKVTGGQPGPWGTVYGRGNFFDPVTKVRFHLIAADGGVYYSRANNPTTALALPVGETVTSECEFYQCFNVVVLARGGNLAPLVMVSIDRGFELITQSAAQVGDGTLAIPNFLRGLSIGNRLLVVRAGTDEVVASDLQDYTRYVLPAELRVNQGEADRIVALAAFGPETVITLKEGRIYQTTNVAGDLSGVATSLVTDRYGCVAARTVVRGDDLYWLSQEGVASLTLTIQNEVQASAAGGAGPRMFSDDIQPLIDRINWNYAGGACAAFHRKRLYLAVPLDDATSFREELVATGSRYDSFAGGYFLPLEVGKTYRWIPGANEAIADNGNATNFSMTGPTDFTAQSAQMSAVGNAPGLPVTASLRQIFKGTNNAVLVYNFVNEAWEGVDQASGLEVKFFFVFPYNGRDRLFFVSPDGWVNLYEETSEDGLSVPYVDVTVTNKPAVGNTLRVNGGTVVTAANAASNAGTAWGCDTLGHAQTNVFVSDDFTAGFMPGLAGVWAAPNCFAVRTTNGVRFYGINGILPAVVVTGAWATLTYHTRQGIATDFVSRGYATVQRPLGVKRGQELEVQMETWGPQYSLSVIGEGVSGETVFVSAETRDRTKFDRPWDAAPFVVDNSGNNFATAGRQDYSVVLATAASQLNLQNGIALDLHQEVRRKAHAPARAQAAQVRVVNTAGRIRILGIGYKGFEIEQNRKGAR